MKLAKYITAAILTVSAATSFADTKCDHKLSGSGMFANTNPPVKVVKTATATTQTGTR